MNHQEQKGENIQPRLDYGRSDLLPPTNPFQIPPSNLMGPSSFQPATDSTPPSSNLIPPRARFDPFTPFHGREKTFQPE